MPAFTYSVRNANGRAQQGTQEAASADALVHHLRERGCLVLSVRPVENGAAQGILPLLDPRNWLPPRSVDVELSLQQMAVMLRSGLTLLTALRAVAEYAHRRSMSRIWEEVAAKIQRGSTLADAMSGYRCFSHMVIQLVRVGEQTGTLDQVVARAADGLMRRRLLRNQVMTAMFYPAIVLIAAIAVATFMVVSVIPKLQVFLKAMGRRLPPITELLVGASQFIQTYGLVILLGLMALTIGLIGLYLWPRGRLILDRMALRAPVVGHLMRLAVTVQFAHGLGILLRSGITLVEGLRTVETIHRNRWAAARVAEAREAVLRGGNLAIPLLLPGVFMPMLSRMVAVGESAGTLDDMLLEVATFHENRLQSTIKLFSAIIEPIVILVVGGIVGFVYIAFFVALFSAAGGPR